MAVTEGEPNTVVRPPQSEAGKRMTALIDRFVRWLARHWLAIFNTIVAIFVALPFLAPVLMHVGATGAGKLIYFVYMPTCHQLPERSYFLFGPKAVYSETELEAMGAMPAGINLLQEEALRYPGNSQIGYKVAFCERDVAIYGSILVGGLVFGVLRKRGKVRKLPLWGYALFALPMAIDGFTQLFGLRESDWVLRTITGVLFGGASVWLAYPFVQEAMDDILRTTPIHAETH